MAKALRHIRFVFALWLEVLEVWHQNALWAQTLSSGFLKWVFAPSSIHWPVNIRYLLWVSLFIYYHICLPKWPGCFRCLQILELAFTCPQSYTDTHKPRHSHRHYITIMLVKDHIYRKCLEDVWNFTLVAEYLWNLEYGWRWMLAHGWAEWYDNFLGWFLYFPSAHRISWKWFVSSNSIIQRYIFLGNSSFWYVGKICPHYWLVLYQTCSPSNIGLLKRSVIIPY